MAGGAAGGGRWTGAWVPWGMARQPVEWRWMHPLRPPLWGLRGDAGGGFKAAEMQDAACWGEGRAPTHLDDGPDTGRLSTHGGVGSFAPNQFFPRQNNLAN